MEVSEVFELASHLLYLVVSFSLCRLWTTKRKKEFRHPWSDGVVILLLADLGIVGLDIVQKSLASQPLSVARLSLVACVRISIIVRNEPSCRKEYTITLILFLMQFLATLYSIGFNSQSVNQMSSLPFLSSKTFDISQNPTITTLLHSLQRLHEINERNSDSTKFDVFSVLCMYNASQKHKSTLLHMYVLNELLTTGRSFKTEYF